MGASSIKLSQQASQSPAAFASHSLGQISDFGVRNPAQFPNDSGSPDIPSSLIVRHNCAG
jgi:hypothetical protein